MTEPVGYRLEFKPGDPCYYSPKSYKMAIEAGTANADTYGLFTEPQPDCSNEIEVYKGWCWVQPKYVHGRDMSEFTPLYRGPLLVAATEDEQVLFVFPSIVELRLQRDHPHLFPLPRIPKMNVSQVQFGQYAVDVSDFENIQINGAPLSTFSTKALEYLLKSKLVNVNDQDVRRIVIGIKYEMEKRTSVALSALSVEQLLMHAEMLSLVEHADWRSDRRSRAEMTNLLVKGQTPKTGEFRLNFATVYLKHVEGQLVGFADHRHSTWAYGVEVVPYCALLDCLID